MFCSFLPCLKVFTSPLFSRQLDIAFYNNDKKIKTKPNETPPNYKATVLSVPSSCHFWHALPSCHQPWNMQSAGSAWQGSCWRAMSAPLRPHRDTQTIMLLHSFPSQPFISLFSEEEFLRPGFKVLNTYTNIFFFLYSARSFSDPLRSHFGNCIYPSTSPERKNWSTWREVWP